MPKKKKPLAATAANIARVLKDAGFQKSVYERSRQVRGWGTQSPGYKITTVLNAETDDKFLTVVHEMGSDAPRSIIEHVVPQEAKYRAALAASFRVVPRLVPKRGYGNEKQTIYAVLPLDDAAPPADASDAAPAQETIPQ